VLLLLLLLLVTQVTPTPNTPTEAQRNQQAAVPLVTDHCTGIRIKPVHTKYWQGLSGTHQQLVLLQVLLRSSCRTPLLLRAHSTCCHTQWLLLWLLLAPCP
jgi:hypothetical protein